MNVLTLQPARSVCSTFITNALSQVHLNESIDTAILQNQTFSRPLRIPSRLTLEMCSQPSQELLCTPDYATPVEQQFHVEYDPSAMEEQESYSKSPACSPQPRHTKRARHITGLGADVDSEGTSQPSQERSSGGEPSTCSKTTQGANRPPKPRKGKIPLKGSPKPLPNPFLTDTADSELGKHEGRYPGADLSYSFLRHFYKLGKEIGHGNYSKVYKCTNVTDGKEYALKRTKRPVIDLSDKAQWIQEVQALSTAQGHQNIIQYFFSWAEKDLHGGENIYICMELCMDTLSNLMKTKGAFKEGELANLLLQMASALSYMHKKGVCHLDIKPDNIFITCEGVYKLGDFGLATKSNGKLRVGEGDARYLAPEMINGDYSNLEKADVFALGASMYELATGRPLPTGGDRYQQLRRGEMFFPCLTMQFQNLIKKMMSQDPSARPTAEIILKSAVLQTYRTYP